MTGQWSLSRHNLFHRDGGLLCIGLFRVFTNEMVIYSPKFRILGIINCVLSEQCLGSVEFIFSFIFVYESEILSFVSDRVFEADIV